VLLIPYVALSLTGFAFFVLGAHYDYLGVAAVGAVLFIAIGATVAVDDLEAATGEKIVERNITTENVTVDFSTDTQEERTVVDSVTKHKEYQTIAPLREFGGQTGPFALGGLQMLVGGLLLTRRLNEVQ
jgi:hypothetical protein